MLTIILAFCSRCSVPGTRAMIPAKGEAGGTAANSNSTDWCDRIVLHESTQTLFALFQARDVVFLFPMLVFHAAVSVSTPTELCLSTS